MHWQSAQGIEEEVKPAVSTSSLSLNSPHRLPATLDTGSLSESSTHRRPLILVAVLLLVLTAVAPRAIGQAQTQPNSDDPALALARRLLGPWGDSGGLRVELSPQQLPDDLPVELPLPAELTLLGSLANYGVDGNLLHSQIVLDSPFPPDETGQLLERAFTAAGWTVQEQGGPTGFTPANAHVAGLYCAPENVAFIHMNSFGTRERITDVRLEVNTQELYSPCGDGTRFTEQPLQTPLPALAAPEGSEITLHGGTYLEDQASSSAVLTTDLPADELLRHFESQLERAGWTPASGAQPGQSIWTLAGEEGNWRGTLALTDLGGSKPQYYASFVMVPSDRAD